MFRTKEEYMKDIEADVNTLTGKNYIGFKTQTDLMEFCHKDCTKGYALKKYAEMYNIDISDCMGFGDTSNDNQMLKTAGISVCLFLSVRLMYCGVWGLLTKMLASFMFVTVGFVAIIKNQNAIILSILVLLGLLCGLIGDILLDLKVVYKQDNDIYLNSGMLAFFIGHLFYFVSLMVYTNHKIELTLPLVISVCIALALTPIIIFGSKKFMKLNFGKFFWQTMAYSFILIFLSAFSVYLTILNSKFMLFAIGLVLILISDLILSQNYFKENQENNKILVFFNHLIYYAGQIIIATALFFI